MKLLNPIVGWTTFPKGTPKFAISQKFGENPAVYAQFGWLGHEGIDYAAPKGTPVRAMADGWIVEATAKDTGYGIRIVQWLEQEGKGYDLIYGHFEKINYPNIVWDIKRRDFPVKAGHIIGYVDSTGFSSGNHLHTTFRPYKNGKKEFPNNGYGGAIDHLPFIINDIDMQPIFQKTGDATLYFAVGSILVPFASDFSTYQLDFASNPIVELDAVQFAKFTIATGIKVVAK